MMVGMSNRSDANTSSLSPRSLFKSNPHLANDNNHLKLNENYFI